MKSSQKLLWQAILFTKDYFRPEAHLIKMNFYSFKVVFILFTLLGKYFVHTSINLIWINTTNPILNKN